MSPNRLNFWLCLENTCLARRQFLLLRQAANFAFFLWHCKGTKISKHFQIILQKKHAKKHAVVFQAEKWSILVILSLCHYVIKSLGDRRKIDNYSINIYIYTIVELIIPNPKSLMTKWQMTFWQDSLCRLKKSTIWFIRTYSWFVYS